MEVRFVGPPALVVDHPTVGRVCWLAVQQQHGATSIRRVSVTMNPTTLGRMLESSRIQVRLHRG